MNVKEGIIVKCGCPSISLGNNDRNGDNAPVLLARVSETKSVARCVASYLGVPVEELDKHRCGGNAENAAE